MLHIRMTQAADKAFCLQKKRNLLAASLTACLCISIGGLLLYTIGIVVSTPEEPELVAYVTSDVEAPPQDHPVTQERMMSPPSVAPIPSHASVLSADAVSEVAIASEDIEMPTNVSDLGQSLEIRVDFGTGVGKDLGSNGAGFGSEQAGASTLTGVFYDLKQTRNGASTGIASQAQYIEVFNKFIRNWDHQILSKYFKSPVKLFASHFYFPATPSEEAARAYKCADKVQGSYWVAVYSGKVVAPKTGRFRFVGSADDIMVVNFNGENVFDFGWSQVSINQPMTVGKVWQEALLDAPGADKNLQRRLRQGGINVPPVTMYKYATTESWNQYLGGNIAGKEFSVVAGKVYEIKILLADNGGVFGEALLIEEIGGTIYQKDPKYGSPIFPLFRTNYALPDPTKIRGTVAPFDPLGLVWPVVK